MVNNNNSEQILCCYTNTTKFLQITRSEDSPAWQFERIVFPGERLLFEALPKAKLEVYICTMGKQSISATITCDYLRVDGTPAMLV
ncbi:MAG: DUF1830 domain-containing protein [Chroococcidiopsidaceae cyanobacterium CP_BM_ER_R8_30]|nr:DUF1830 domain-containing protein [Chroococcidiopsidaceae cyanobacterium CP_BM_ER_R8_30]